VYIPLAEYFSRRISALADFIPGVEPYEFLTVVDLSPTNAQSHVVMTVDPMHDATWTERLAMGRTNELDNLARGIAASQ